MIFVAYIGQKLLLSIYLTSWQRLESQRDWFIFVAYIGLLFLALLIGSKVITINLLDIMAKIFT